MKCIKRINEYPKGTPIKLIMKYRECKQIERALARSLKVNVYYVSRALHGERPSNNAIALKLFFPKRTRKPVDYSKIGIRNIFDMSPKELLWRLNHREEFK